MFYLIFDIVKVFEKYLFNDFDFDFGQVVLGKENASRSYGKIKYLDLVFKCQIRLLSNLFIKDKLCLDFNQAKLWG